MSNAERQRAWRERRRGDDGHTDERMTVTVSARTRAALRRLARHYDTSQRDIIERLVAEAEERAAGQAGNPYFE